MKISQVPFAVIILTISILIANVLTSGDLFIDGKIILKADGSTLNPIPAWNNLVTSIGLNEKLSPPELARVYALVHISIYDSLLASNKTYQDKNDIGSSATAAGAASTVLSYLFPDYNSQIYKLRERYTAIVTPILNDTKDSHKERTVQELLSLGERVGKQIVLSSQETTGKDRLDILWNGTIPQGPCIWNGSDPILPMAGSWKTYVLTSASEIQPREPTICGSEEDIRELKEVYQARISITPKQIAAAHYWGDKLPPVIWNDILNERITKNNMNIFDAAYASVYLNVGMYDGFISCWSTKYDYWTARPFQRIPNFTTVIPTPNFPGYTSGHSVISAVASEVLGEVFPDEKSYFEDQAMEAASSRFWSGIHFKQDIIAGLDQGIKIGNKIVGDMHEPLQPFVYERLNKQVG
jgi:hypothetical protein